MTAPALPTPEIADEAARAPIDKPPESAEAAAHPEALVPPPQEPVIKKAPQSAGPAPAIIPDYNDPGTLLVDEPVRGKAERELASYLGAHINPALTNGLILSLKEHPNNGFDGIELCFQSPLLTTNSGFLGEEVITALQQHPVLKAMFQSEVSTPRAVKPGEAEKSDMMHIQISQMTPHAYSAIMHALAEPPAPQHEMTGTPVTAPAANGEVPVTDKKEIAALNSIENAASDPSREITDPAKIAALQAGTPPVNTVQAGPVAELDKMVANDNEPVVGAQR